VKEMELRIHPPLDPVVRNYALSCLAMGEQPKMHDPSEFGFGTQKRLADAELAAEVWCQETEFRAAVIRGDYPALDRLATMGRFATLPHFDEEEP
jgi:hypothetical protein